MRKYFSLILLSFFAVFGIAQSYSDKKIVIQKCIDLEELQPYFHEDLEGRKPLIIFDNGVLPNTLKLTKFDEPVVFMTKLDMFTYGKIAYLHFTTFTISTEKAEVIFKYDVEGITVKVSLVKIGGVWEVESESIVEG